MINRDFHVELAYSHEGVCQIYIDGKFVPPAPRDREDEFTGSMLFVSATRQYGYKGEGDPIQESVNIRQAAIDIAWHICQGNDFATLLVSGFLVETLSSANTAYPLNFTINPMAEALRRQSELTVIPPDINMGVRNGVVELEVRNGLNESVSFISLDAAGYQERGELLGIPRDTQDLISLITIGIRLINLYNGGDQHLTIKEAIEGEWAK